MERRWTSLSALDRRVGSFFFLWDIFNIFLGAMLVRGRSSSASGTSMFVHTAQPLQSVGVHRHLKSRSCAARTVCLWMTIPQCPLTCPAV